MEAVGRERVQLDDQARRELGAVQQIVAGLRLEALREQLLLLRLRREARRSNLLEAIAADAAAANAAEKEKIAAESTAWAILWVLCRALRLTTRPWAWCYSCCAGNTRR